MQCSMKPTKMLWYHCSSGKRATPSFLGMGKFCPGSDRINEKKDILTAYCRVIIMRAGWSFIILVLYLKTDRSMQCSMKPTKMLWYHCSSGKRATPSFLGMGKFCHGSDRINEKKDILTAYCRTVPICWHWSLPMCQYCWYFSIVCQ